MLFHGSAALFIGTMGALLLANLPAIIGQLVLVLMPIPMVFCLWKCLGSVPQRTLYGQGLHTQVNIPTKFLITSLVQGLALGVMHSVLVGNSASSAIAVSVGYFAAVGCCSSAPSP